MTGPVTAQIETLPKAVTAADYAERYRAALDAGSLRQGVWNSEEDGRHVACALGVIGNDVDSVSDCPAQIMPKWLARMVPWLFDTMRADDAFSWGLAFTDQLKRLDGKVPFSVVYDWQGNVACELGIEAAEKRGRDTAPHKALQELHRRALGGDRAERDVWHKTLRNAYANAYTHTYANANANANADTYTYTYADAYAYTHTYANANAYKTAIKRLADGLVECLGRVEAGK